MVEGLGGGRKQVIRLTVGREKERGEVEHDKIISIYIYLYLFSKVTQLLFRKTRQVSARYLYSKWVKIGEKT